ncbi:hypothetical protein NARC_130041 [Candidatus Nitrosocosmicus arcticus]|uniref:Uncharacterized protein n=1 Tax=Candidatus Nitrosocosmicus arcticus TaxID=2035267 RepID=A0A557SSY0_9ARCH|nr:hypothetical protein NARC_130041 [Candidatus Nitrosocosmicus arcticus]
MKNNSPKSSLLLIQPYMENFQKNFAEVKNKSSAYLNNNTEKDFLI